MINHITQIDNTEKINLDVIDLKMNDNFESFFKYHDELKNALFAKKRIVDQQIIFIKNKKFSKKFLMIDTYNSKIDQIMNKF